MKILEEESKNSDVCLLLKLLDSLESKKRGSADKLLKHLNSRKLIISFPLRTIGGKKDIKGKRNWFEKIIKQKKYVVSEFILGAEKYYVLNQ